MDFVTRSPKRTNDFLLDGFLHGLIERDPPETVRKFIKYNFPQIMKKLGGKR
jgi:hypothetical protein